MREGRYGDAIWARYHMDGRATGNIIAADNTTVTEEVHEDAIGYRAGNPDHFAEVAKKYNGTSRYDGHREMVDIIMNVLKEDLNTLQARVTYNIKCSDKNTARRSYCYEVLELMDKWTIDIGDIRTLDFYENCWLRVGEYGSGADLTWEKAHAVAVLIFEDCQRSRVCCYGLWVSGYSPKNAGHRKVCLSSKSTGCTP
ncbi:uncharacterized protein N7483_012403 [Penicillium malachiteum]|uniref:uncharacterized protein n=1 Tax=Penicillium malachiteum TaxID=1324776 RepID=UPI00254926A0|nr:uncharacterized protein N7483_012403 [Penicillium malachiteum]KAJ5715222.1 hypothetical protein N7483_012403 [Penicillium malachiteum]